MVNIPKLESPTIYNKVEVMPAGLPTIINNIDGFTLFGDKLMNLM